jgi:hypothetical protein
MPGTALHTYGVYLRPDPLTCKAVADLTDIAKRQFGIVSAAAFPPHATLAGAVPSDAAEEDLIEMLTPILAATRAITVFNSGIARLGPFVVFDIDRVPSGEQNHGIHELACTVNEHLSAMRRTMEVRGATEFSAATFQAHLSLATHDLTAKPDLADEVEDFLGAIPHGAPPEFAANKVMLYRFESPNWSGEWWRSLRWSHLHTWTLASR